MPHAPSGIERKRDVAMAGGSVCSSVCSSVAGGCVVAAQAMVLLCEHCLLAQTNKQTNKQTGASRGPKKRAISRSIDEH